MHHHLCFYHIYLGSRSNPEFGSGLPKNRILSIDPPKPFIDQPLVTSQTPIMSSGSQEENDEKVYQFSASETAAIRQEAATRLVQLRHHARGGDGDDDVGAKKNNNNNNEAATTTTAPFDTSTAACFARFGFVHKRAFCTAQECQAMKDEMQRLVDEEWDPAVSLGSFGTDDQANTARGDYFLESADKIHYFAEPAALTTTTKDGQASRRQVLKPEYQGARKIEALNKVGHALHIPTASPFGRYFRSSKLVQLVTQELSWATHPVVPQSMYIFKQAVTGGTVRSHQDATFLYTTPRQSCLGLWLALDDATVENGCLWIRPGSHTEPVRRRYRRNPAHFGSAAVEARSNEARGNANEPKFVMTNLVTSDETETTATVPWDGKLPDNGWQGLFDAGFVPVECQAGDLLAFTGTLDHLSLPNFSNKARHTFQLHLVEGPEAGVTWATSNWLQYPDGRPFEKLKA